MALAAPFLRPWRPWRPPLTPSALAALPGGPWGPGGSLGPWRPVRPFRPLGPGGSRCCGPWGPGGPGGPFGLAAPVGPGGPGSPLRLWRPWRPSAARKLRPPQARPRQAGEGDEIFTKVSSPSGDEAFQRDRYPGCYLDSLFERHFELFQTLCRKARDLVVTMCVFPTAICRSQAIAAPRSSTTPSAPR